MFIFFTGCQLVVEVTLWSVTVFMAQSKAGAAVRGQRKGKNVMGRDALPPPISSESTASNVEGRGLKDNDKYPLWKYVTREDGPNNKGKGGGNVQWK